MDFHAFNLGSLHVVIVDRKLPKEHDIFFSIGAECLKTSDFDVFSKLFNDFREVFKADFSLSPYHLLNILNFKRQEIVLLVFNF
ncbi:hypothetical protein [Helicobacter felis]|uniref:hypothetical protein n=1 Tax=Helicobacter felis TaxID=214 RepID=UPI000CF0F86A|nr:hypothetical protein [Helicobacter felis]